jgi:putative SOS response-associated peptidase YedK
MCNSYARQVSPATLKAGFAEAGIPLIFPEAMPDAEPTESVRPTDPALLIKGDGAGNATLVTVRWGLPPSAPRHPLLISMPSEGRSVSAGRALVPASGFYGYTGTRYPKTRWTIAPLDREFVTFAALWKPTPEGPRFGLLTVVAGPDIAATHDRQPAVVLPEDWATWLDEGRRAPHLFPSKPGTFRVFEAEKG